MEGALAYEGPSSDSEEANEDSVGQHLSLPGLHCGIGRVRRGESWLYQRRRRDRACDSELHFPKHRRSQSAKYAVPGDSTEYAGRSARFDAENCAKLPRV